MLTDQQMADVRRFAGYPLLGDMVPTANGDLATGQAAPQVWQQLDHRLTTLRPEEETRVGAFLTALAGLETDVLSATDNLDTAQAAVWVHNQNEVQDRMRLYRLWRRELCNFVGIPPGPGLGDGGISMARG